MNRSVRPVALPAPDVEITSWDAPWSRLLPLWRYGLWMLLVFAAVLFSVGVRLDVKRTLEDLDRNEAMQREAKVLNERLRLEFDARRRAVAMETVAAELGLSSGARLVQIREPRP